MIKGYTGVSTVKDRRIENPKSFSEYLDQKAQHRQGLSKINWTNYISN